MLLAVAVLLGTGSGCDVSGDQIISATSSISPATLQSGELVQVFVGGVLRRAGVIMPVGAVCMDHGEPIAEVMVDSTSGPTGNGIIKMHLGDTITAPGAVTITLVSFDRVSKSQAVTFLIS